MSRLRSVDVYRGVAVLLMIVAHVCDAFLADVFRGATAWHALDILFGFVAPAFLFLSGVGIGLAVRRRERSLGDDRGTGARNAFAVAPDGVVAARLDLRTRLILILALAYWLQIPVLSLRQLVWNQRPEELARLFDSNILHVVAVTGLLVVAIARAFGVTTIAARALAGSLAIATIVATPYVWDSSLGATLWLPLRALVGPQPASTFPLLPYASFGLFGFIAAPLVASSSRSDSLKWALAGLTLLVGGLALDGPMSALPHHDDFWHGTIQHTIFRLGGVLLALGASIAASSWLGPTVTLIERVGQRSLAVYVLHLMLIYGSPMTMGARSWLDGRLDRALPPGAVAGLVIAVAGVVCAAALLWPILRQRAPRAASMLWLGWWIAFAGLFLLTP